MKMQIVNADDVLISLKSHNEIDYANDIYRVSALWLKNSEGKILIAQRSRRHKHGPSLWGPATAGTVEEGESYEQNIYKEVEEEIGVTGITLTKGPKQRVTGPRNFFCQWFTAVLDKPQDSFVLQEDEVDAVQWVEASDLVKDVAINPSRYISEMPEVLKIFIN